MRMKKTLLLLLACLACSSATAQEQYRSKVLEDPDNQLGESAVLSIQELENSLSSMNDAYAKSSTERYLARHYLQNKEYDKAIAFYENALAEQGLSQFANIEMLQELLQVYMMANDYKGVIRTVRKFEESGGKPDANTFMMVAHASFKLNDYVTTADALDKAMAAQKNPDQAFLRNALAVYYNIGNYKESASILERLLELDPHKMDNWMQLVSIYLKMNDRKAALTVLSLAWQKKMPFNEREATMLADLFTASNNPHQGARILEEALEKGIIPPGEKVYNRLFNYWLQAREKDKGMNALKQAANYSNDSELFLHLAQLYMEQEDWKNMQATVLRTCSRKVPDRLISRANLLLGISQLKLGDREQARRSFINATLIGGEGPRAGQYLRFMKAEPPTEREKRKLVGPCSDGGSGFNFADDSDEPEIVAAPSASEKKTANINIKTVEPQKLFYGVFNIKPEEMQDKIMQNAVRMGINIVKSGGKIDGPLHLIFEELPVENAKELKIKMAFPVAGRPSSSGQFRMKRDDAFKCAYRFFEGKQEDLPAFYQKFFEDVVASGHELSGEIRQIADEDSTVGQTILKMELQIGIK